MRLRLRLLPALLWLAVATPPLVAQESIEGAWTIVEAWGETSAGEEWNLGENVQPSFFIFFDGYYSFTAVNGAEPRPQIPEGTTRADLTPEESDAVWRSYLSNSGSYEVSGSNLITRPSVALWPPFMAENSRPVYELGWDGADLLVTTRAGESWRIWRLRRLD